MISTLVAVATFANAENTANTAEPQTPSIELSREVARWKEFSAQAPADNEDGKSIRESSRPLLADAEAALAAQRPWLALSRLSVVWGNLAASRWVEGQPAERRKSLVALEAEWAKSSGSASDDRDDPDVRAASFAAATASAAGRALAEGALAQAREYREASLEYGRNTVADAGFFYLGAMRGQREFARFAASIPASRDLRGAALPAPTLRDLTVEIEAVEDELLAAYRPPASIESHGTFIRVSALLKEARELNDAGARFGALHRLLDARHRLSRLLHPSALDAATAQAREREVRERLARSGSDPSLALLFVEAASADADPLFPQTGTVPAPRGELAKAVFDDLVPLYFAALGPAPPRAQELKAQATVTLIRWPYT
jgi:hypothetical protein